MEGNDLPQLARPGTKQALLFAMLGRPDGATIHELAAATGWKRNTVHSALATIRRQGLDVASDPGEGGRRYTLKR